MIMLLSPLVASAHDIEVKNADGVTIYYKYINNGKELAVSFRGDYYDSYYNEYMGNVVIPEEVTYGGETRRVTSIGYGAFFRCFKLTSVTIPPSVTRIGGYVFSGCTGLTSVAIPEGIREIGFRAFEGCTSLTSVTIPSSVTTIFL